MGFKLFLTSALFFLLIPRIIKSVDKTFGKEVPFWFQASLIIPWTISAITLIISIIMMIWSI